MVLMRDVGGSLADIAAFMHEMELRHGLQPKRRGIEKIRQLALKLQDSSRLTEVCSMGHVKGGIISWAY